MNSDKAGGKSMGWSWMLVGVLSAVMIIVFFAAMLVPTRIGKDVNPKTLCLANLRMIEGVKLNWALENHKLTNDIPGDAELFGELKYVREKPLCPAGGIYTIGPIAEKSRCSIRGHTI